MDGFEPPAPPATGSVESATAAGSALTPAGAPARRGEGGVAYEIRAKPRADGTTRPVLYTADGAAAAAAAAEPGYTAPAGGNASGRHHLLQQPLYTADGGGAGSGEPSYAAPGAQGAAQSLYSAEGSGPAAEPSYVAMQTSGRGIPQPLYSAAPAAAVAETPMDEAHVLTVPPWQHGRGGPVGAGAVDGGGDSSFSC